MRVCDYIAEYFWQLGVKHVYGLMGGGASGLNDGFIKHGKMQYICFHNEQGAAHAAVAESKLTGNISLVNPTTGCGGTNCITSLLAAWQDSVPVIFISGNVGLEQCSRFLKENTLAGSLRKYGIQEHDIIDTVKSITKAAIFLNDAKNIKEVLDQAVDLATRDRPGPVWIDIPSNIQTALLPDTLTEYKSPISSLQRYPYLNQKYWTDPYNYVHNLIVNSDRPVVLAGQGIKQGKAIDIFQQFIENYNIPYVYTYGASDLLSFSHPLNVGAIGIKGSRAGNFAMQSADVLIIIGCSLNNSHTGYDYRTWSPYSKKIFVNNDANEHNKYIHNWTGRELLTFDQYFNIDVNYFLKQMVSRYEKK